jgi:hypothetical protein
MLSKSECREYFNEVKPYVNFTTFCKELGIARPHLSMFMKDWHYDHYMTIDKCNRLVEAIKTKF